MGITQVLFWFFSALAVFAAGGVVISRSPVYSVLWLIVVFFAISGHYVLMNAQFLAIVNIIVYAGAIMVLFLNVIMFVNLNAYREPTKKLLIKFSGVIAGLMLLIVITAALSSSSEIHQITKLGGSDIGLIKVLGKALFKNYLIPFEISSVLFLSAMIGAVLLGMKESVTVNPKL